MNRSAGVPLNRSDDPFPQPVPTYTSTPVPTEVIPDRPVTARRADPVPLPFVTETIVQETAVQNRAVPVNTNRYSGPLPNRLQVAGRTLAAIPGRDSGDVRFSSRPDVQYKSVRQQGRFIEF